MRARGVVGVAVLALVLTGSSVASTGAASEPVAGPGAGEPAPVVVAPVATTTRPAPDLAVRGTAADAWARARGGRTGIVIRDRLTGAVWRTSTPGPPSAPPPRSSSASPSTCSSGPGPPAPRSIRPPAPT